MSLTERTDDGVSDDGNIAGWNCRMTERAAMVGWLYVSGAGQTAIMRQKLLYNMRYILKRAEKWQKQNKSEK